jgi:hypothetical protein
LGGVLLNIVASFLTVDWLDSMTKQLSVDQSHVDEWIGIVSSRLEKPGDAGSTSARIQPSSEVSSVPGGSKAGDDMDTDNNAG